MADPEGKELWSKEVESAEAAQGGECPFFRLTGVSYDPYQVVRGKVPDSSGILVFGNHH